MLIFVLLAAMFTANDLKQVCTSNVQTDRAWCSGWLGGFAHAAIDASNELGSWAILIRYEGKAIPKIREYTMILEDRLNQMGCPYDGIAAEQTRLIFLKYVDNHPEQLHLGAEYVLSQAMRSAFPCKKELR